MAAAAAMVPEVHQLSFFQHQSSALLQCQHVRPVGDMPPRLALLLSTFFTVSMHHVSESQASSCSSLRLCTSIAQPVALCSSCKLTRAHCSLRLYQMKSVVYLGALHDCVHHVPNFDDGCGVAAGETRLATGQFDQARQALNEWYDRTWSSVLFHDSMANWLQHLRDIILCALYFEFHSGCGGFISLLLGPGVSGSHPGLVTNLDVVRAGPSDRQCTQCIVWAIRHICRPGLCWLKQVHSLSSGLQTLTIICWLD